jgi:hypothetical protein
MKRVSNWAICAVLLLGIGFIVLNRGFPTSAQAQSPSSSTSCSNATLKGTYVFGFTGLFYSRQYGQSGGTTSTPFAYAGLEVYGGDGKSSGVSTTAQPVSQETFTGTYTVNSNCTVTETDTYQNGSVYHYNEYTGPTGNNLTFVQTDPNYVDAGFGTRVSGSD